MSFELLDTKDTKIEEGRSCVILCNFNGKEAKTVGNLAGMIGLRDRINISYKNGNTLVKDVIEGNLLDDAEDGVKSKAIIFNNVPGNKIGLFIENLKKFRLNNVLKATVTETSREWTIDILLKNLVAEKIAMQTGKDYEHKE